MNKLDNSKRRKITHALNFLEELSWLLDSRKAVDLKELPKLLMSILDSDLSNSIAPKYTSENENKNILVGILPNLFLDSELFKSNNDLVDFAESVLKIGIARWEKRSRYEIIGLIVCTVPSLNDSDLTKLVEALVLIAGNKDKLSQIKEAKENANFSWNETIQKLTVT